MTHRGPFQPLTFCDSVNGFFFPPQPQADYSNCVSPQERGEEKGVGVQLVGKMLGPMHELTASLPLPG